MCQCSERTLITDSKQLRNDLDTLHLVQQFFIGRKLKCTLVQALRLCIGRTAHRGSRGIALPFHDHGTRTGVRGQIHAPAVLYPRERPVTNRTGGGVGPRAGLDRCGKSRPHRDSIPGPSSP